MRVGPHPHALRLDSLRSLAAAAGASLSTSSGPKTVRPIESHQMRAHLACAVALALSACTAHRPPAQAPARASEPALEFLGEFVVEPVPAGHRLETARFGGISGLTLDLTTGELLGICDEGAPNRVFVFRTDLAARPFRVDLKSYFPLPLGPGAPERLDPEALAMTRAGRLFVASEGFGRAEPRVPPAIVEFTRRADYVGRLAVPSKFIPPATGPLIHGVRANEAFESLTVTPDDQRLFTGTETALVQDGEPADAQHGTVARILEYQASGGSFEPRREFGYPVDPMPATSFTPSIFISGLVELLALDGTELLSLERAYAEESGGQRRNTNRIRIFHTSLAGATDVSSFDSLRGRRGVTLARKTLVLDLADVLGLSPALPGLENFEGMGFGPPLPDGSRTILLVSDDNFSQRQRTTFLLFRLRER